MNREIILKITFTANGRNNHVTICSLFPGLSRKVGILIYVFNFYAGCPEGAYRV